MDRVLNPGSADSTAVPLSLAQRRDCVAAAVAALQDVSLVIHQAASNDLASVLGDLDHLRALAEAGLIVAAAEAEQRGVIDQSQFASTAAWVRDAAWHLQTGGSAVVAKCGDPVPTQSGRAAGRCPVHGCDPPRWRGRSVRSSTNSFPP